MGRQQRPLDATAGPVQSFAAELRVLHEQAGSPKYLQMARKTGKSRTALAEAAGGDHLPTWETVAAFVTACGGDPATWRVRWEQVRDDVRTTSSEAAEPQAVADTTVSGPPDPGRSDESKTEPHGRLRRALPFVVTALVAAIITSTVTVAVTAKMTGDNAMQSSSAEPPQTAAVIMVQNKVALGPSQLIDDSTPAYLSSKTIPFCASNGCKVPGTDLSSGAMLVAVCHTNGTEMFNYNLDSSESKQNPNRANSTLWYQAVLPDGRSGYISEIYIVPADRGGKGLPVCSLF